MANLSNKFILYIFNRLKVLIRKVPSTRTKRFLVIENSRPVLERLQTLNKGLEAKTISTFDFSTLFTKLPHDNLIEVLCKLVNFVFNNGRKTPNGCWKYLTVKGKSCFFTRKKNNISQS